ncbi:hypothetical protein BH09MYX1_BH09MYX1_61060 [soil metagenome]
MTRARALRIAVVALSLVVLVGLGAAEAPLPALVLALVSTIGALVLATTPKPEDGKVVALNPIAILGFIACCIFFVTAARAGVRGRLGNAPTSALLVAAFIGAVFCAHAARAVPSAILRRGGFWILAIHGVIGLPSLGAIGLFDPWEAHYGEVAREMLARRDAVSTFWGHEGWFTSKPVLLFWLQALALRAFGVHAEPGHVLEGANGAIAHPEWALRLPIFAIATIGIYVLYMGSARAVGERSALAAAIAVATTPFWIFLARQSITDMPLVGFLSAAMGMFLAATAASDERVATITIALGPVRLRAHAAHAVAALALFVALPQAAYLVSQNVTRSGIVADVVREGSPGNCWLPGQVPCAEHAPRYAFPPALQGAIWIVLALALFWLMTRDLRRRRVLALGGWVFAALATMAKGPLGLALPLATIVVFAISLRRPRLILDLLPPAALACAICLVLPWYVATYVRHGRLFVDELVLRHMLGRTLDHLHDTNEGDDTSVRYYLAQLAFGLGPWTGVVLLGVARALSARAKPGERFFVIWAAVAFALVTIMRTKFHHYVFPAVPPLAMLAGATLVRDRDRATDPPPIGLVVVAIAVSLFTGRALLGEGDAEGPARLVHLFTYQYARPWPASVHLGVPLAAVAALGLILPIVAYVRRGTVPAVAASVAAALFLGNVYLARTSPHWGQRAVFDAWAERAQESSAPLVAYRMNWKGENFYAGNRLAILGVTPGSGGPLSSYVASWRGKGARAVFVVTERGSIEALRGDAGAPIEVLTSETDSRQFCLVRIAL